jgi:hypothetical protein
MMPPMQRLIATLMMATTRMVVALVQKVRANQQRRLMKPKN